MHLRPVRHQTVDSTNERALAAIAAGRAQHGDLHLALAQTAGRGRRGRRWHDEPGASVLASAVLLPDAPLPHPEVLTMGAGLALLATARALGLERAALDWPNDLVVAGAKLAGVLVESRGFDPARPHYVVGVGINVTQRTFAPELTDERRVTSLALEGLETTREVAEQALTDALGRELGAALQNSTACAAAFARGTGLVGRAVHVTTASGTHRGRLLELDLERGLRLATGAGDRSLALPHVLALDPAAESDPTAQDAEG